MRAIGTRKTFTWKVIGQPGDYFQIAGGYLIEDVDGGEAYWRMLQDVPGGVYCALERYRF